MVKGIGSIECRGKNSYRLIVSCGLDEHGKQIKKTKTVKAKSEAQARKLLADFVSQVQNGLYVDPSKLTFNDFAQQWLKDYANVHLEPKTVYEYKNLLNSRIVSAIGYLKLDKIKPTHLLEFYSRLMLPGERQSTVKDLDKKNKPLSANTVLHYHRLISSILQKAVEWQVITENVAKRVKPPKVQRKPVESYDEEQTLAMLAALSQEPIKYIAMVTMAIYTGGRREEVLGLEWKHIDLNNGVLTFEQASQYIPNVGIQTKNTLKNKTSIRKVDIPPQVVEMLISYKEWQDKQKELYETPTKRRKTARTWIESDRLFTKNDGQPIHPDTISKWFPKFLARHKLPHLPFKNLRHTHATLLLSQGVPIYYVSKMLGHAQQSTADRFYGKPISKVTKDAIGKLDKILTIPKLSPNEQ